MVTVSHKDFFYELINFCIKYQAYKYTKIKDMSSFKQEFFKIISDKQYFMQGVVLFAMVIAVS